MTVLSTVLQASTTSARGVEEVAGVHSAISALQQWLTSEQNCCLSHAAPVTPSTECAGQMLRLFEQQRRLAVRS